MAIYAQTNNNYDPQGAIDQKYRPLTNIQLGNGERDTIKNSAENRMETLYLKDMYYLRFTGDGISRLKAVESAEGRKPPLAIVSSGRSRWIRSMYDKGKKLLNGQAHFRGINDVTPLRNGDKIPLYFPYRFSDQDYGHRGVYVFVQQEEYSVYAKDLAGTGMMVIGYNIGYQRDIMLGFGASRYAAIRFFSHIDVPRVWLMDDNVLYITKLSGFDVFETRLEANGLWALGARGLSRCKTKSAIRNLKEEPSVSPDGPINSPNFLQQAILWDVKQLTKDNDQNGSYNYSPYFIRSGEDISISYFLGKKRFKAFSDCVIFKGSPDISGMDEEQSTIDSILMAEKMKISLLIEYGAQIPINHQSTLWLLIQQLAVQEARSTTYIKAAEQILLKWMTFENQTIATDALGERLLNRLFNFTLEEQYKMRYDVDLIDTNPPGNII